MNSHFNVFDAMLEDKGRVRVDKYYLEWYNLEDQYYCPVFERVGNAYRTTLFNSIKEAQEYAKKSDREMFIRKTEVWVDV